MFKVLASEGIVTVVPALRVAFFLLVALFGIDAAAAREYQFPIRAWKAALQPVHAFLRTILARSGQVVRALSGAVACMSCQFVGLLVNSPEVCDSSLSMLRIRPSLSVALIGVARPSVGLVCSVHGVGPGS